MRIIIKDFYLYLLLLIVSAIQVTFFITADIRLLMDIIPDDAAYYFRIAQNFNQGYGFSFDTIHQTNGFQPLWQYILIGLYAIFPFKPDSFFRLVLIFQTVLLFFSSVFLYSNVKKNYGEEKANITIGIFLFTVFLQAANGMESALVVFAVTMIYIFYSSKLKIKNYFYGGVLTAILLLSRIDFIYFPVFTGIILLIRKEWRKLLMFLAGFIPVFLPYIIINYLYTGFFTPISGVLKSGFPSIYFNFDLNYTFTGFIAIGGALTTAFIYLFFNLKKLFRPVLSDFSILMSGMALTIILHFLFYLLFIKWPVLNYYFFFYGVFFAVAAADLIRFKITSVPATIFLAAVFLVIFSKEFIRPSKNLEESWHARIYHTAMWVKNNTPEDAVFAMKDAGNFSFFSGRKVINVDGLVNDYTFQEFIRAQKLKEYLRINKVSYYSLYDANADDDLCDKSYNEYTEFFMSYMYNKKSDALKLYKEKEIYRNNFGKNSLIVIWTLN